jgi:hypothetical protein
MYDFQIFHFIFPLRIWYCILQILSISDKYFILIVDFLKFTNFLKVFQFFFHQKVLLIYFILKFYFSLSKKFFKLF